MALAASVDLMQLVGTRSQHRRPCVMPHTCAHLINLQHRSKNAADIQSRTTSGSERGRAPGISQVLPVAISRQPDASRAEYLRTLHTWPYRSPKTASAPSATRLFAASNIQNCHFDTCSGVTRCMISRGQAVSSPPLENRAWLFLYDFCLCAYWLAASQKAVSPSKWNLSVRHRMRGGMFYPTVSNQW
jgi:hypothetical protein